MPSKRGPSDETQAAKRQKAPLTHMMYGVMFLTSWNTISSQFHRSDEAMYGVVETDQYKFRRPDLRVLDPKKDSIGMSGPVCSRHLQC